MYKLIKDIRTNKVCAVKKVDENLSFLFDPDDINNPVNSDNADYREYLKWLAEGNTPQPADE